LDRVAWCPKL